MRDDGGYQTVSCVFVPCTAEYLCIVCGVHSQHPFGKNVECRSMTASPTPVNLPLSGAL